MSSGHSGQMAWAEEPSAPEFFEQRVRPLLVARCQECHGPDKQWAELRLDSAGGLAKGGENGPVVVSGKPDESELMARVAGADGSRMPPEDAGAPLSAEQIGVLRRWIELGAHWPETPDTDQASREERWRSHWAFQPVRSSELPAVDGANWIRTPIDAFILQRLEAAGLTPSPEADRRTLIRRATYDLTGLPPTPAEVEAFAADPAADAYERLIERLLASPRYGEQWGRHWLDVARYADTKGYVYAREERFFVNSAPYRDWVIDAFNRDLPFDRFVLLQLAADQATGAPAAGGPASEEPAANHDPRQLAAMGFLTLGRRFLGVTPDIIDDRIDVVGRGLLGLTVGCARCHDHKYDPIPTADYYSLYGVFQNCYEELTPIPRAAGAPEPSAEFLAGLAERQKKLADTTALRRAEHDEHLRTRLADYLFAQRELDKYPELTFNQLTNKGDILPGLVRRWEVYLATTAHSLPGIFGPWHALGGLPDAEYAAAAANALEHLLASGMQLNPRIAEAFQTPPASPRELVDRYGSVFAAIDQKWRALCEETASAGNPAPAALSEAADEELREVLYGERSPCEIPQEPLTSTEYFWDTTTVVELWTLQGDLDRWLLQQPESSPYAVVLRDRADIVDPQIFRRGNPANKTARVPRQFLSAIAGPERKPFQHGSGRLELAQSVIAPGNPLTSRVWVNRVWARHFGRGLVTTQSDFGLRAAPPSHPELLDWLASEFVRGGWSTKALHRLMMLSAAYRQDSRSGATAAGQGVLAEQADPENRLLGRMNPHRLTFEQFRDSLLAQAGDADLAMGGKGADLLSNRRTVYTVVDRQFLPTVLSAFDFANPDLHSPERTETTIPQQSLFALNHPFVAERARTLARRVAGQGDAERVAGLYQTVLQRAPNAEEMAAATEFLTLAQNELTAAQRSPTIEAWSYGYGEYDPASGRTTRFKALLHFTGSAWQGGPQWPDAGLGWVQLTSAGGHTGNDRQHAAIRRWIAPAAGAIKIRSEMHHPSPAGDGVDCWIVSSRGGLLRSASVHNRRERMDLDAVAVEPGDTIDFVTDVKAALNNDQFFWSPTVELTTSATSSAAAPPTLWDASQDFAGPAAVLLSPFEQLAQLLMISNEALFVD